MREYIAFGAHKHYTLAEREDVASARVRLAAYAGTTPRVYASGGKVHYGSLRPDVNRTLRWALAEAAWHVLKRDHPDLSKI